MNWTHDKILSVRFFSSFFNMCQNIALAPLQSGFIQCRSVFTIWPNIQILWCKAKHFVSDNNFAVFSLKSSAFPLWRSDSESHKLKVGLPICVEFFPRISNGAGHIKDTMVNKYFFLPEQHHFRYGNPIKNRMYKYPQNFRK